MRPTDENQFTSMRPNLMSPRRPASSDEDSILAMLEREPARKRGGGAAGARMVWYGASATLAVALTGALVWLVTNNDGLRPDAQETAQAATVLQVAMAPAGTGPQAQAARPAVIVDQAPPAEAPPPLRLLKPAPEQAAAAAATAPVSSVARAAPSRPAAPPVEAKPAPRPAAAAAAKTKAKPIMAAKGAPRPFQPKARRSVNPARSAEAPVDADVALISAVIVHANGHAPDNAQMTELLCPNDSCQARPPRQQ